MGEAAGDGRDRGARAREGARRQDLRRAARLRRARRTRTTSPTPDPTGENPARALTMAFADAGIEPEDVGYVNAHGTSTPSATPRETRVLKLALGEDKAYRTPISSTKGATGHCLGAAGAVEAIFTILALERGVLPPTINQTTPDPTCDLDYIPNEARHEQVESASQLVRLRRPQRLPRLPPLARRVGPGVSGSAGRQVRRCSGQPQLEEQRVAPDPGELGDPLPAADDAEAGALVQGDAGGVLREDAGLDRPDPGRRGSRLRAPASARCRSPDRGRRGDVDAVLRHARVAGAARYRRQGRPSRRRLPVEGSATRRPFRAVASRRRQPRRAARGRSRRSRCRWRSPRPRSRRPRASRPPSSRVARAAESSRRTRIELSDLPAVEIRRPDRPTDFDEVLALVQACDHAVYGDSDWTADELREEWDDLDLERRCVGRGRGRPDRRRLHVHGAARQPGLLDGYVHPGDRSRRRLAVSRRRRGARARARCRRGAEPPTRRRPPTLSATRAAPELLTGRGYTMVRTYHRMSSISTEHDPGAGWPDGSEIARSRRARRRLLQRRRRRLRRGVGPRGAGLRSWASGSSRCRSSTRRSSSSWDGDEIAAASVDYPEAARRLGPRLAARRSGALAQAGARPGAPLRELSPLRRARRDAGGARRRQREPDRRDAPLRARGHARPLARRCVAKERRTGRLSCRCRASRTRRESRRLINARSRHHSVAEESAAGVADRSLPGPRPGGGHAARPGRGRCGRIRGRERPGGSGTPSRRPRPA